jgi:hypothetical protein
MSAVHSLCTRLTLIGGAILLVGLALGGIAFDRLLEHRLTANLDETLLTQAADRARSADAGADTATLVATIRGETAIAVFDEDGSLLDSRNLRAPRSWSARCQATRTRAPSTSRRMTRSSGTPCSSPRPSRARPGWSWRQSSTRSTIRWATRADSSRSASR